MKIVIKKGSVWQSFLNILLVVLLICSAGYTGYTFGYRQGCNDTMDVVENRADKLVKNIEQRLFGG